MKQSLFVATLLALLLAPLPARTAQAQTKEDLNLCLCRNLLARTLCKQPQDFSFIDEYRDSGTYSFTVFYAKQETRFLCMVSNGEARLKGKAWQTIMRTVPFEYDAETSCAMAAYSVPECPQTKPVVCCGQKTKQELSDDKAYEFWTRPIPDILEDELKNDQQPPDQNTPGQNPPAP